MMDILIRWLLMSIAIMIAAFILPGVKIKGFGTALITALVLGIVNAFIRPIILILTLPINIITLGLFTFVINSLMILLTSALVSGFQVRSFGIALLYSIILSVINFLIYFWILA